jgi:hypothetical protein
MKPLRELTLEDMLADPIVHLMMQRDGVEETQVRALMARLRDREAHAIVERALSAAA